MEGVPDPRDDEGWAYWLEHGWDDDNRARAISRFDPDARYRKDADWIAARWQQQPDETWTCDAFDPDTRLCTAHDDRPPLCREFPWYDDEPGGTSVSVRCSFLLDLPPSERPEDARPLIPLTVLR